MQRKALVQRRPTPADMAREIAGGRGGTIKPIQPGEHRGRPKGVPNKMTTALREAILMAAEMVGRPRPIYDKKNKTKIIGFEAGEGGLVGYIVHLALTDPKSMSTLLRAVLPLQITGRNDGPIKHEHVYRTVEEIRGLLKKRGVDIESIYDDGDGPIIDVKSERVH